MSYYVINFALFAAVSWAAYMAYSLTTKLAYGKHIADIQKRILTICANVMEGDGASPEAKQAAANLAILALSTELMEEICKGLHEVTAAKGKNASESRAQARSDGLAPAIELYVIAMMINDKKFRKDAVNFYQTWVKSSQDSSIIESRATANNKARECRNQNATEISRQVEKVGAAIGFELSQMGQAA